MKRVDAYISKSVLGGAGVVAIVVAALVVLSRVISQLSDVGHGGYGWLQMAVYVLLKTPDDMLMVVPVITFLGALMALGALASGRELVVLRSAGVSMVRLVGAVSVAGIIMAIIAVAVSEYAGPAGNRIADNIRHVSEYGRKAQALPDGVWLRQADTVIHIGGMVIGENITNIDIYRMDSKGRLRTAIHAGKGRLGEDGMLLYSPRVTKISIHRTRVSRPDELDLDIVLNPDILQLAAVKPEGESSWALWRYINYLEANHINANDYRLAFWRNVVLPFTVWLLTIFALPFAFGSLRSSGAGQRLFLGGLTGLVFYLVNQIVGASGMVYGLPPWLAASLPTLLLGAATVYWIKRLN